MSPSASIKPKVKALEDRTLAKDSSRVKSEEEEEPGSGSKKRKSKSNLETLQSKSSKPPLHTLSTTKKKVTTKRTRKAPLVSHHLEEDESPRKSPNPGSRLEIGSEAESN